MELGIINIDNIAPVVYDWGAVKWVVDDNVAAGTEQSFGIVHVNPGKTNPEHWHTNAQEIVHMLQGECDIRTDGETLKLRAGQTLFIPVGETPRADEQRLGTGRVRLLVLAAAGEARCFAVPAGPGSRSRLAPTAY